MTLPTYFVSHGGGPWPWMKDMAGGRYDELERSLQAIARENAGHVRAVLMVTGHWETPGWHLSSSAAPGMVYDYYGFPPHTYQIRYSAPGDPALAERVRALLARQGIDAELDSTRGLDHGTFTVMQPMYPEADMPVVQLSIRDDYDVQAHLAVGEALAPLRDEGILIIGSGLSYHNLRAFGPAGRQASQLFDDWLADAVLKRPPAERAAALLHWAEAPSARMAHPREDHLVPLFVAAGAAGNDVASRVYHEDFMGSIRVSSYRFGAPAAQKLAA